MSDIDKDLQRRLRSFADVISPEPGRSTVVVRKARMKRRLVALSAGLAAIAVVGGVAGAATVLGNRDGIKPAPGPEETACAASNYDIAVLMERSATRAEVAEAGAQLEADPRVADVAFVGAGEAPPSQHPSALPPHSEDRYLVDLEPGIVADPKLIRALDVMGAGTYALENDCPSEGANRFARYLFEVAKGDASAHGVLEVNTADDSVCVDAQTRKIKASHLLWTDPDRRDARATPVLTFFDPGDGEGADLPPSGRRCFAGEQLGELDDDALLARLVNNPHEFRIDFHRGPNDEPGLVAELVPQGGARDDDVESLAAALFKDDELEDAVPTEAGFSLRQIIRNGPDETNHDYATVGVQMEGPVSYARVIFFVHPTERDAAEIALRRSESLMLNWKTRRDVTDEVVKPFAVSNALPGSTCGSEPSQLVTCHVSLGRVIVLTQSTQEGPGTPEELEAATTLIRSFGSYLERIYPQERRSDDADHFVGLLEDTIEAQDGVIRLHLMPETLRSGAPKVILSNESEAAINSEHFYLLEQRRGGGWLQSEAGRRCGRADDGRSLGPGQALYESIHHFDRDCERSLLQPGRYRITKMIELESGDRLPLTVPFSIAPAADNSAVRELVRDFMELRVNGAGAEEFLDRHGRAEFRPGGDLAPLYPDPPLQDFEIEFVDDVGNETYEVGVSLVFQQGSYGETLFVQERNGKPVISGGRPGLEGP